MGSIRTFNPVKLFVGVLASEERQLPEVESRLTAEYGPIDLRSPVIPEDHILRMFFSFEHLVDAERLPDIKHWTNNLESETSLEKAGSVKRPVNLDPGYLEHSKVILASTKNFYHRMYLGRGIFGEVTMHFRHQVWEFFPWTYSDYQSEAYQNFFLELRGLYRAQLKTMCLLKRT
jgi:hypothetical protein